MIDGFTYFQRTDILRKLQEDVYDVVIIGGGITGAGIALDAASRGMKTALVEQNDYASGTSSKSTKLIHGGLRYLKQLHFKMVAEVGRERRIVHNLAPHLVIPEKMLLPVMKKASMGMISISVGLKLYDLLAGVKGEDRRKMLGKTSSLKEEPLLPGETVVGSGLYAEYRTDDARLTIEIIKTAHKHGAVCTNYVKASQFLYENNKVSGIECTDMINNGTFTVRGKYVINAAGPWVDELRAINHSKKGKKLFITKGVHLVVPWKKLPVHHSMYFEIRDGRMIFLIPRDEITYIGTTDTPYNGQKDHIQVTGEDADYLLRAVNDMLPAIQLKREDVESSWAGLRPLIYEEGKSASEISRKDEIFVSASGLISMAGGKLTGYRIMAKKVVDRLAKDLSKNLQKKYSECKTLHIPLVGNRFKGSAEVNSYIGEIAQKLSLAGVSEKYAPYLVHNYGIQSEMILDEMQAIKTDDPEWKLLEAELTFCIDHEMVCKPLDFIERRTGRLYFWMTVVERYADKILETFRDIYRWSEEQYEEERETFQKTIHSSKNFD